MKFVRFTCGECGRVDWQAESIDAGRAFRPCESHIPNGNRSGYHYQDHDLCNGRMLDDADRRHAEMMKALASIGTKLDALAREQKRGAE